MDGSAAKHNQDTPKPAIDTEQMYREMAEREDPREAAKKALEQQQKAEAQRLKSQQAKGRSDVAAAKSAERAALAPSAEATPAAPAATPPAKPQAAPAAAPATAPQTPETSTPTPEQTPSTPPATPPTTPSTTPPATPGTTTDAAAAAPAAAAATAAGFGDKFKDFFGKMWEGIKKMFEGISGKFSEWFGGKKPEAAAATTATTPAQQPAATATPSSGTETATRSPEKPAGNLRETINQEAQRLGIEPAFALAIITMESGKKGLNENGTPVIRFEPHVFNNYVQGGHGKWGASTLVGRNIDGVSCEGGQAAEHACLQKAIEINQDAAYKSMSVGQGQIMGFNAGMVGYQSAEAMFRDFSASGGGELAQVKAMFKFIEKKPSALKAAREKNFGSFTRAYNGSKPGTNLYSSYTAGLERAYRANSAGQAPGTTKPDEAVA